MAEMTASELIALKSRVNSEMLRRSHAGSLAGYAGSSYNFPTTPTSGSTMMAGQGNAIIIPLLAVRQYGNLSVASTNASIPSDFDNTNITHIINNLASEPLTTSSSSCNTSCSGLCVACTSCSGCDGCSGCGSCSGCGTSCSDNCHSGCDSGCKGCDGCSGSCDTSCSGWCDKVCGGMAE